MMKWLKRIGVFAAFLIALEVVAYVGLTLLGPTAFRDMRMVLNPFGDPTPAVSTTLAGGAEQRCSTYRGELFCITDGVAAARSDGVDRVPAPNEDTGTRRCAEFEGETICIEEDF